ncbi:MAG: hypothetical protein K2K94_07205 [Muribaculaceae bacterium]|nr:hypothetical protein [Muribaculaceae bacterium]
MELLKVIQMKHGHLFIITLLTLVSNVITSCDREEDRLIPEPTETSTFITGYIKTPDGKPLANIPVAFDYNVTDIFGTAVVHKAKGKTDKSGFYKIFFETDERPGVGLNSGYAFTVDFSVLSSDKYIIAKKVEFGLSGNNTGNWSGSTITCNFTIPLKKLVTVNVVNDSQPIKEGKYAVKNMFPYYTDGDILFDRQNFWDEEGKWRIFESVDIPQNGSISVTVPLAIGVENAIRVVYHGDATTGYPNGIPASEGKVLEITDKFNDEIELNYFTPETRWDNL